jgi:uncharacterized protein (TIGR03067 family)
MRRFLPVLMCAFVGACVLGGGPLAPAVRGQEREKERKKELAALQGTWKCLRFELDGKILDQKGTYIIDGHKMTWQWNNGSSGKCKITIDPSRGPAHLDVRHPSGQTELGIYARAGDYLVQCGNYDGKPRPTRFATGVPGGGQYLVVWKFAR